MFQHFQLRILPIPLKKQTPFCFYFPLPLQSFYFLWAVYAFCNAICQVRWKVKKNVPTLNKMQFSLHIACHCNILFSKYLISYSTPIFTMTIMSPFNLMKYTINALWIFFSETEWMSILKKKGSLFLSPVPIFTKVRRRRLSRKRRRIVKIR